MQLFENSPSVYDWAYFGQEFHRVSRSIRWGTEQGGGGGGMATPYLSPLCTLVPILGSISEHVADGLRPLDDTLPSNGKAEAFPKEYPFKITLKENKSGCP